MKTLFIIALLLVGNGCEPVTKENPSAPIDDAITPSETSTSNNGPLNQESQNPGEIHFKLTIVEAFDSNKNICGLSKPHVMKMAVQEILEYGSGIVNLPNKNEEVLMNFLLAPKELTPDLHIEVKARESLCQDASKTYFTIISYKIIE